MGTFIIIGIILLFIFSVNLIFSDKKNKSSSSISSYKEEAPPVRNYTQSSSLYQEEMNKYSKIPSRSPKEKGVYLLLDTETTGLPRKRSASPTDFNNWPYIVEIAWFLIDEEGLQVSGGHYILRQNVSVPIAASNIHRITTERMLSEGIEPKKALSEFSESVQNCQYLIAHNIDFDIPIIECELLRNDIPYDLSGKKLFCTMENGKRFCTVYDRSGRIKKPTLTELFGELHFNDSSVKIEGTHGALADTLLLYHCFMTMIKREPRVLHKSFTYPSLDEIKSLNEHIASLENELEASYTTENGYVRPITDDKLLDYFPTPDFNGDQVLLTGMSDKERLWGIVEELNGKVVKSVTVKLGIVVIGPLAGWVKMEKISNKIKAGEKILIITDMQLELLYNRYKKLY